MNAALEQINQAAALVVPEIILVATACIMFLAGPFLVTDSGQASAGLRHRWGVLSLLALGSAAIAWLSGDARLVLDGPFRSDDLLWYARGLTLVIGVLLALLVWNQVDDARAAEAQACLLIILAGVSFTAAANDLVTIFLALELVSIPTYVLLYLPQRDTPMREATLKYFLLSVFSSALVLYGMAWLFGSAGTTSLNGIVDAVRSGRIAADDVSLRVACLLLFAGLSFRITAVPFHFYAPDVFQGVTASAAAMLSVVPKVVGFAALIRLLPLAGGFLSAGAESASDVQWLLGVVAVVTMFGGNLLALRQSHLHRLLAYSSVAHAGYMLAALTVGLGDPAGEGISALLFYLLAYAIMTIGVFAVLSALSTRLRPLTSDADLAGLSSNHPAAALLLAVCLFSLTGLPPTGGFLGKFNLFVAAWSNGSDLARGLAIALAINAAIAAWYYLRLVAVMYLEPAVRPRTSSGDWPAWVSATGCTAATVMLFALPQPAWDAARRATQPARLQSDTITYVPESQEIPQIPERVGADD